MSPSISISRGVIPSWHTRVSSATNGPMCWTGACAGTSLIITAGFFLVSVCPSQIAQSAKQGGDQGAVNLHRMLDDQEAVLRQLQDSDEQPPATP
jgi:hypothetical protein